MSTVTSKLYGGDVTIAFSEGTHRYKVTAPESMAGYKDGVTTPLRILNKPELLQWAANMACNTMYEAYDPKRQWSEAEFSELLRKAKYAHITYRDAKAEIGTRVHAWIAQHIAGKDTEYDEVMTPAIENFLKWEADNKPQWLFSERLLYSKEHDYCGTVDGGAIINGLKTVIDFKTGSPDKEYNTRTKRYTGKYRARVDHFIQEGGYTTPLVEEDRWMPEQLMMMYLSADGGISVFTSQFVEFWQGMFKSVLQMHRDLKKANKINEYEWKG